MSSCPPFFVSLCVLLTVVGCRNKPVAEGPAEPQVVSVSTPVVAEVQDYVDFTGRTEAVESVDLRARVTGYLDKVSFKDGAEIKQGDLLFNIDPRTFKAQYDQALAKIKVCEASVEDHRAELARGKTLLPKNAISLSDYDKAVAEYAEATASLTAAQASAELARLNLGFTVIASPISGRISRTQITAGNLVKADDTLLTTVVSQDPMYVYFDVDEHTMLRIVRIQLAAKENVLETRKVPVLMGVADEEGFPHRGFVDFANNVVDASTGTITARGVFTNPAAESSSRLLRPGMFVRVRLPFGQRRPAVLAAERALGTDQGKKYLLVVDDQQRVQYRPVETGPLQDDGLRVIREGLRPGERVIVSGLQLVRPKMEVRTEQVPMPRRTATTADTPPPGTGDPRPPRPQSR
jgi:multidrug efflux system membrane fusion protein